MRKQTAFSSKFEFECESGKLEIGQSKQMMAKNLLGWGGNKNIIMCEICECSRIMNNANMLI